MEARPAYAAVVGDPGTHNVVIGKIFGGGAKKSTESAIGAGAGDAGAGAGEAARQGLTLVCCSDRLKHL